MLSTVIDINLASCIPCTSSVSRRVRKEHLREPKEHVQRPWDRREMAHLSRIADKTLSAQLTLNFR